MFVFDFQKFAGNSELESVIDETLSRYPDSKVEILSDDELGFVAAAGQPDTGFVVPPNKKDEREK